MVTGTNMFARSVGSAIGVAILGALANAIYAGTEGGDKNPHAVIAATGQVFWAVAIGTVLALAAALAMPRTPVPAVTGPVATPAAEA